VKIEVLYSPGCPHHLAAIEFIHEILAETGIAAQIELIRVETEEEARRLEFIGSPTVRVDGLDVETYVSFAAKDFRLRCRQYTEGGDVLDWPSRRMLRDTIEVGHLAEMGLLAACC